MKLIDDAVKSFHDNGFLVIEEAVTPDQLAGLRADFASWIEESRGNTAAYGETIDGRPRFDLEPGHSSASPALRRVSSPQEISDAYLNVMRDNRALDMLTEIYGPNIKFNNAKVNSKLPGAATEVKYHQDFLFEPHSNDDLAAVLIFLDDVTEQNGPLEVIPKTHRGPLFDHWHDGVFTGAVSDDIATEMRQQSVLCTGPAGTACIMHTRLLHGSTANRSALPRTLYIVEYAAEDAVPLIVNHIPSRFEGEVVRGKATGKVRSTAFEMAIPEYPQKASFFDQQAKH
ncbi:MAG: phytanoyl-CoA dioxygenase family protein [Pseudomonadota bacterium]